MFGRDLIKRGQDSFFRKQTAIRFLSACDDHGFYVVALEGFRLAEDPSSPDPNWIADYSSWAFDAPHETIQRSRWLIAHAPDEMSFRFVVRRS